MNKSKGGLEIQQVIFNAHVFTLCCSRNVYKSIPDSLDIFIPGWVRYAGPHWNNTSIVPDGDQIGLCSQYPVFVCKIEQQ